MEVSRDWNSGHSSGKRGRFLTAIMEKPEGEIYVRFDTRKEVAFELKNETTLWLEETNRDHGVSPGTIRKAAETFRLYRPDRRQVPLSDNR